MKLKTLVLSASAAALAAFASAEAAASKGTCREVPDFLMILGYKIRNNTPDPILILRAKTAAEYLCEHKKVKAICCGGILSEDQLKSEAQTIKEILMENGVEEERILLEDKSETTLENFKNAKKIVDSFSLDHEPKIAFLSSECHLLRASLISSLAKIETTSIPAKLPRGRFLAGYIYEALVFPALAVEYIKKR